MIKWILDKWDRFFNPDRYEVSQEWLIRYNETHLSGDEE